MTDPVTHKTPIGPAMVLHPDTYYKLVSTIEKLTSELAVKDERIEELKGLNKEALQGLMDCAHRFTQYDSQVENLEQRCIDYKVT